MIYFILAAAFFLVTTTERRIAAGAMAVCGFLVLTSVFLLATASLERAGILALLVSLAIFLASSVKHHHSGMKLTLADLALTFAGTIPFMLKQYRLAAAVTLGGFAAIISGAIATLAFIDGDHLSWPERAGFLVLAAVVASALFWLTGGADFYRPLITQTPGYLSTFTASVIDLKSWWRGSKLRISDIAADPLPLVAAIPARDDIQPDILIIQQESLFDPRIYGLPVEPEIARFLQPPNGIYGRLHVDIFGGGSWQSEFSVLTGLSSASFGPDSYFLFNKGVGRFRHSLPFSLKEQGYRTQLVTSCRRNFLNYDAFYAGIGVDERVFTDDMPIDLATFEETSSDSLFLPEVGRAISAALERDTAPRLTIALTNYNHGPHDRRLVPSGTFEAERAFALAALPDSHYGEYYARLAETATAWSQLRQSLISRGRPTLVLRYGDHQPTMIRRIEHALGISPADPRQFQTFWAMEAIGFDLEIHAPPDPVDIAFIGTLALKAAGLALDPVNATRLTLMDKSGSSYFASTAADKYHFHRTLVSQGLIQG